MLFPEVVFSKVLSYILTETPSSWLNTSSYRHIPPDFDFNNKMNKPLYDPMTLVIKDMRLQYKKSLGSKLLFAVDDEIIYNNKFINFIQCRYIDIGEVFHKPHSRSGNIILNDTCDGYMIDKPNRLYICLSVVKYNHQQFKRNKYYICDVELFQTLERFCTSSIDGIYSYEDPKYLARIIKYS
jgi:hypothetical protein